MKNLLIVVDYQNDFVDGALGFEQAVTLEKGIAEKIENHLQNGGVVIFTRDTHEEDYMQTREGKFLPVPHCIEGTSGHSLYGKLSKYEQDTNPNIAILNKVTFGAINLPEKIKELCGGVPQSVEFCGVVTNICVLSNVVLVMAAFENTPVKVHGNLCAALGTAHEEALQAMRGLGVEIL